MAAITSLVVPGIQRYFVILLPEFLPTAQSEEALQICCVRFFFFALWPKYEFQNGLIEL